MGMITRVRGRVRSDSLSKIDPRIKDEKMAKTVCLLSVVLLLPYCGRGPGPLLIGSWLAAYSCLVLPLLISANYKYPIKVYSRILNKAKVLIHRMYGPVLSGFHWLYAPLDRCEMTFIEMTNFSTMANQLVFFVMCDRVLAGPWGPEQRVTCLYSLMFYNVIAYCVAYIKELVEKENWSPYVNMTHHSDLKHLAMTTTKIVLEWTKAVTFIITVTFMLLVFGLERGLQNYQPTSVYQVVTWCYYMATEKVFVEMFPAILSLFHFEFFESLETLYIPVLLRLFTIALSSLVVVPLLFCSQYKVVLVVLYVNIYLRSKDMWKNSWRQLRLECAVLEQFRRASKEEIDSLEDVCAVCLCVMKSARVTPCQHFFHGDCLRQCLKTSDKCPICIRQYKFEKSDVAKIMPD